MSQRSVMKSVDLARSANADLIRAAMSGDPDALTGLAQNICAEKSRGEIAKILRLQSFLLATQLTKGDDLDEFLSTLNPSSPTT
jgi:hypothetical protein